MRILILGYSKLFKNKLINALNNISEFTEVHIAKFKDQEWDNDYLKLNDKKVILYDNYDDALKHAEVDIAYISTVNSAHYEWAKKSINKGWHTIIDKPSTVSLGRLKDLIDTANEKGVFISESLVYIFHPQFNEILRIFNKEQDKVKHIVVSFSFPPLNADNFRYNKDLGGGAINDLGPYTASIGRYFFIKNPEEISYNETSSKNDVETSFDVMMKYSDGRSMIGHFGFTTEYTNSMTLLGEKVLIEIDRVFTFPDKTAQTIKVKINNKTENVFVPNIDTFESYFDDVLFYIRTNFLKAHQMEMLLNVEVIEKIKQLKKC